MDTIRLFYSTCNVVSFFFFTCCGAGSFTVNVSWPTVGVIFESLWRCWLHTSFFSDDESLTYTSRTNSLLSPGLKAILHKVLQGVSYGVLLVNKTAAPSSSAPYICPINFTPAPAILFLSPPFLLAFLSLIPFRRVSKEVHLECSRCGSRGGI